VRFARFSIWTRAISGSWNFSCRSRAGPAHHFRWRSLWSVSPPKPSRLPRRPARLGERFRCGSELVEKLLSELPDSRVRSLPDGTSHRSEEHTSELQSRGHLVCRLLLEKKKKKN